MCILKRIQHARYGAHRDMWRVCEACGVGDKSARHVAYVTCVRDMWRTWCMCEACFVGNVCERHVAYVTCVAHAVPCGVSVTGLQMITCVLVFIHYRLNEKPGPQSRPSHRPNNLSNLQDLSLPDNDAWVAQAALGRKWE